MKRLIASLVACALFAFASPADASHYVAGAEGFLAAALPKEGGYFKLYNSLYHATQFRDNSRHSHSGNGQLTTFDQTYRLGYNTGVTIPFINASWIVDLCLDYGYYKASGQFIGLPSNTGSKHVSGLTDVHLCPLLLHWHGDRWDFFISPEVYFPTGDYSKNKPLNLGTNYYGFLLATGVNYWIDDAKSIAIGGRAIYEHNYTNKDTHIREGAAVHLELAAGKVFSNGIYIALDYCGDFQIRDDQGNPNFAGRYNRNAIGAEVGYLHKEWGAMFTLKYLSDFSNKNKPQGDFFQFCVLKTF